MRITNYQSKKTPQKTPFGNLLKVLVVLLASFSFDRAWGQLSITAKDTPFTIDFTTTVGGVNNGTFNGSANVAVAAPGAGQLNSNAWHFVDDGATSGSAAIFGITPTALGKGTIIGAATNDGAGQGWYAQNVGGTGNIALYWQPQGAFATSGMVTLRVTNNTGSTISNLDLSYRIREINNRNGTNGVKLFTSTDNVTYTAVTSLDYTSVNAEPAATINITGITRGATTIITHASGANSGIAVNDIVFFNGTIGGTTQLRLMSGVVLATTATTTTVAINSTSFGNFTSGGQFVEVNTLETVRRTTISPGGGIPNGSSVFIRWFLDGTGQDELSIDDISFVADAEGLVLTNPNVSTVIDFDNTVTNVNNSFFTAPATFSVATPAAGQLNRATWSFENDGAGTETQFSSAFGVDGTAGQGISPGTVAADGWYAFDVPDVNSLSGGTSRALGWQSNTGFATNGAVTLKVTNNTGTTIQDFRISYNIWENNNTNVSNRVRVLISTTNNGAGGSYVLVPNSTHNSVAALSGTPAWVGSLYNLTARSAIGALSIPNGGSLFVRFYLDNNGTNAEGDEMAIDDISIIASVAPLTSINPNRGILWAYDGFDYYQSSFPVTDVDNDGVNDAGGFKGVPTVFNNFSPGIVSLHGVTTNTTDTRYRTTNGHTTLGWAGDWLSASNPNTVFFDVNVTSGRDVGDPTAVKPTIPITSASEQRSVVNSGMYVEGGNGQVVGRRIQTSTGGYAFQYTATNTTNFQPCTSISGDCPAISPLRHEGDVRVVNHIATAANQGGLASADWTHTNNTLFGAQGSTAWVGVMLRKNVTDNDEVYISLHKNTDVFNPGTGDDEIQIGYFGASSNDGGGNKHWGVRVNGTVTRGNTNNSRITTAQMINGTLTGQPLGLTPEERVFDLLVARIDFGEGAVATSTNTNVAVTATAVAQGATTVITHGAGQNTNMMIGNTMTLSGFGGTVMNITNLAYTATQVTITHAAGANTGLQVGSRVFFNGIGGNGNINGRQGTVNAILSATQTRFDLNGVNNTYTTGGTATVEDFNGRTANVTAKTATTTTIALNSTAFTAPASMGTGTVANNIGLQPAYTNNHRVRLYVIRDIARDGISPNPDAYPIVANLAGYSLDQGKILDDLGDDIIDTDGNAVDDFVQHVEVDVTVPSTMDISFNSMAYFPGTAPDASAMDEFRLGGSFNQAALNSPVISLVRGLCSANGGTIGLQSYQGGSFGEAQCLDANGNPIACAGGTTTATGTSGTQEIYDAASTDVWGSAVNNSVLDPLYNGTDHPSYPNAGVNHVVRAGGSTLLFNGGPTYRNISGGVYNYQLNTGSGPNDNNYLIGTQSRHSFGPAWIPFYDNSPNRNGYLMSINAAYARGKFFDQTISGLCADTQYEFSVDIINVLRDTRVITNESPYIPAAFGYSDYSGSFFVATDTCDPSLEPGCAQFSRPGSTGSTIGLGSVTRGGTGASGTSSGGGGNNKAYSLNPEIDFALNDSPIYTVPISIPNDKQWHRVGLTFVTKANLSQALNLSMRNLAPGGMGNDLAIDNISFRPCGSYSRLIDANTVCANAGAPTDGRIQTIIGRAGNSYSNSKVRFQKWTPFPYPISLLVTNVTNTGAPTTITVVNGGGANDFAGTYRVPVGAEVTLLDLTGLPIDNTTAIVTAKTANTITIGSSNTVAYPGNTGVVQVTALPSALITGISQTNPVVVTLSGTTGDDIALNTLVTFSGVTGMTQINGLSGRVTSKTANTITIGSINATAFSAYTGSATERISISYPSDDLDGDAIADENEWVDMDFNPYDGKNYTVVDVTTTPIQYETALVPITPVALPRTITQYNVFYSNGTNFRSMFAGNEANLLDDSGKCRFIIPGFQTNCSILPTTGGRLRAKNTNDGIQLIWSAFQENADVKYILERSFDAKNYVAIADYAALNKDEYKHLDGAPFVGKNYYRIKIVEGNGSFYYTNVATADWGNKNALSIYPNPASDKVNVTFSSDFAQDQAVTVKVLNMMGSQVKNKNYTLAGGNRNLEINTQDLPEGLYLLEIKIGDLDKIVHKMVIKR
ncbi:MAG: T9SS type A sorting domain-containing protein [Raineya sp.]|jgi:hypothetical protein|nr:T9SS type A sorting domain-containing protein [Raineya sp.]